MRAGSRLSVGVVVMGRGIEHYQGMPAHGLLRHAARELPRRTAICHQADRWTYAELNHDAVRCAAMLQARGIRPGDRVAVLLPNVPEYIIAVNGIWRAGGIVVAISPLMVKEEVADLLQATGCRHVITLDMLSHVVDPALVEQIYLVSIRRRLPALEQLGYLWLRRSRTGHWYPPVSDSTCWFWQAVDSTRQEWDPVQCDCDTDPAYILATGGTTGHPKAVTLSHQNLVANAWQQYQWTNRSFGQETMLAVLPFFHSYGMSAIVMGGAAMGATLFVHHRFNTSRVIELIETECPTVFHAVPTMLAAINQRLRQRPANLSSIRWVISGGAPLDAEIADEFTAHSGALVVEGYGLSEASPVTHVGPLFESVSRGTIGRPLPETSCKILDDAGRRVGDGEVGELVVRGPQVMLGYWQDKPATDAVLRDGWLATGDLACREATGLYRIVGRKKDLIITSGYNVFPRDVESKLGEADGVDAVAVVGVPDPQRGELVKAFVVMQDGCPFNEDAIREFAELHLAKHKRPHLYELCHGDLPRNFLGKVIRRHLRDRVEVEPNDKPIRVGHADARNASESRTRAQKRNTTADQSSGAGASGDAFTGEVCPKSISPSINGEQVES